MPNSVAPIIVYATMSVGGAILSEAALSFLGMGVQPPSPSWGLMLSEARSFMLTAPWLMVYPGIAILTTVWHLYFSATVCAMLSMSAQGVAVAPLLEVDNCICISSRATAWLSC
jgi:ABC-type antimicrobial peptide transport system permease subunit